MTDRQPPMDRAVGAWLDSQPERAPAGLVDAIVERTRSTGQRPALLAAALGAPSLSGARGRDTASRGRWSPRTVMLAIALVLSAVLAAAAVSGAFLGRDWRLGVGPSASARPSSPSPATIGPPAPVETIVPVSPGGEGQAYVDPLLGFSVAWDPAGSDIVGLRGLDALPGQPLLELDVPPCGAFLDAARVCGRLLVASWTVADPDAVLPLDNGASQTVAATTLPGVADAWLRAFGPGFREDVLLDGANAVLVQSSRQAPLRLAVIAEHGGRFWLIQTESGAFQPTITHSRFVQLLGSWQWLAANFPFSVRLLTYPATPGRPAFTARSDQTKGYLPPGGDVTTIGLRDSRVCPGASGFAAAICQLEGGGELASTVTVSVDRRTFADAVASLADGYSLVYSRLGDDPCVLALPAPGAVRDPIALVLHGTTVWRVVGHDLASPGTGWDLERFLLGFTPQG